MFQIKRIHAFDWRFERIRLNHNRSTSKCINNTYSIKSSFIGDIHLWKQCYIYRTDKFILRPNDKKLSASYSRELSHTMENFKRSESNRSWTKSDLMYWGYVLMYLLLEKHTHTCVYMFPHFLQVIRSKPLPVSEFSSNRGWPLFIILRGFTPLLRHY